MARHNNHLEKDYVLWLYHQIRIPPQGTYRYLIQQMYTKEFAWTIANDDNRMSDGLDLRHEFVNNNFALGRLTRPCSFLEVLLGLSRRLEFNTGSSKEGWAWQLIENLDLHGKTDPESSRQADAIDEVLDRVIWRTYQPDGYGGFFPLAFPNENQTRVELWYQMSAYIDEIPDL